MKIFATILIALIGSASASCWRQCTSNSTIDSECGTDEPYLCCQKWDGKCCTPSYVTCEDYCAPCSRTTVSHDCAPEYKCCMNAQGQGCCYPFNRPCDLGFFFEAYPET